MGRARQIASNENQDRILLDASAASTDEGEHLLLDASASTTDVGFFINTEIGTTETPPEGFVGESSLASNAVTNTKVADGTIKAVKIDSVAQGNNINKNFIINGAMDVSQRGTSGITGIGASSGIFLCDLWKITIGNTAGRLTQDQEAVTEASGLTGFANCTKLSCTTADTSIAAGELMTFGQSIEGQNLQRWKKGTGDAQQITVSFYAKAEGGSFVFVGELYDHDNTRNITQKFTVTSQWKRHVLTFAADTLAGATMDDDNAASLTFQIWMHAGTTYTGGTFADNTWTTVTQANRAAGIGSFFSSTNNKFFITGVQIEIGDTATEFQHENHESTLESCLRYYYEEGTASHYLRTSGAAAVGDHYTDYILPKLMREAPTWTAAVGSDVSYHDAITINTKTKHVGYCDFNKTNTNASAYYSFNKVTASAEL